MIDVQEAKVSIIIPVYNVEKYLGQCLDSAVGQTHQNKEIIVVNDGSSDRSGAVLEDYRSKNSEIVVITTENKGQACARNTGLEHATGDFVIFLDSDDWLERNTLELCLKVAKGHGVDMVLFNAQSFADGMSDNLIKNFNYTRPLHLINKKTLCHVIFEDFIQSKNYIVSPCLYFYRLDLFRDVRFPPGIIHEDNLFTTCLLIDNESASAICLADRLFHRRIRPDSTMTQEKSIKHVEGYLSVAEELLKNKLKSKNNSTAKALNLFIQDVISSALTTSLSAFKNKIPFWLRKKTMFLFLQLNFRYLNPKAALICIFPEIIVIKRALFELLKRV